MAHFEKIDSKMTKINREKPVGPFFNSHIRDLSKLFLLPIFVTAFLAFFGKLPYNKMLSQFESSESSQDL